MSAVDRLPDSVPRAVFATTRWSMVVAAAQQPSEQSSAALATLCQQYWCPLYAHVRRRCADDEQANDLTQEFFARLLEKNYLQTADAGRGRFRSFLLAAVDHFLLNEWDRQQTRKRGGHVRQFSLEVHGSGRGQLFEPRRGGTPEEEFEREWALTLLENVFEKLRAEYRGRALADTFEALHPFLAKGECPTPYAHLAESLRMSEGAIKVAVLRLRRRFAALLRQEISHTVERAEDIDDELRSLFAAVSR